MPSLLDQNLPSIQENLISSLMEMNNSGLLTYLIQELKGREINPTQEAAVFILISLIIYYYPPIINHPQRQKLEQLYDYCFSMCSSQELFTILEKPENAQVKILLSQYLKQLLGAKPSNKKNTSPKNHLLDSYTGFLLQSFDPQSKEKPPLLNFLLDDYAKFVAEIDQSDKTSKRPTQKD